LRREVIRAEQGQTLILFVVALPLFLALIALVTDGSNLFANKRGVQNVADATALAVARDLPSNGTACAGACLTTMQSDAITYSNLNKGPTVDHACASSSDFNCYQTPYKGNSSVQVRVKREVSTFFGGVTGLFKSSVVASAAVGLGGPPSAVGGVAPVGVSKSHACLASTVPSCFNVPNVQLNFDADGYSLLDLSDMSKTGPTPPGSADANTMKGWIINGYPGLLPNNAWYGNNNGQKTGIKNAFVDDGSTVLLVPVFDKQCPTTTAPAPPECPTLAPPGTDPVSFHVIGFSAFVIDPGGINWSPSTNGSHTLTGHFTTFIASGVSSGPPGGSDDFGVRVITLDE
jgi:hypothetical protein